jgi:hypothetical protein
MRQTVHLNVLMAAIAKLQLTDDLSEEHVAQVQRG